MRCNWRDHTSAVIAAPTPNTAESYVISHPCSLGRRWTHSFENSPRRTAWTYSCSFALLDSARSRTVQAHSRDTTTTPSEFATTTSPGLTLTPPQAIG